MDKQQKITYDRAVKKLLTKQRNESLRFFKKLQRIENRLFSKFDNQTIEWFAVNLIERIKQDKEEIK